MPVDPDVIAALETVVDRDPSSVSLGLHLATLLLDAGRPADALRRCHAVLAHAPADRAALALVRQASEAAGEPRAPLRVLPGGRRSSSAPASGAPRRREE